MKAVVVGVVGVVGVVNQQKQKAEDVSPSTSNPQSVPPSSSSLMDSLRSQLIILDKQRANMLNLKHEDEKEASNESSLLKRAKAAESKVEMLKKQLLAAYSQPNMQPEGEVSTPSRAAERPARPSSRAGGAAVNVGYARGADPAEIRKLQRTIKDLEGKLNSIESSGGGADKKALQAAEKQQLKKIKDMEATFRKERAALESRAIKAEGEIEAATASMPLILSERDSLRARVTELSEVASEVPNLRLQASRGIELDNLLQEREHELVALQEQFKKETFLRKKYKNELEDLKGTIRVYARCRPMAKYEIDRGCSTVVTFTDETSLQVSTSRGEKQFDFDAAFSPESTQSQVFEDTKRLVESCMDGFNVCLFAYGQTGTLCAAIFSFFSFVCVSNNALYCCICVHVVFHF